MSPRLRTATPLGRRPFVTRLVPQALSLSLIAVAATAEPPRRTAFLRAADCRDCEISTIAALNLPETGVEAYSAKLLDPKGVQGVVVTLLSDGTRVSEEELVARERDVYRERYGILTRELARRLEKTPADEAINIWIWTDVEVPRAEKERFSEDPAAGEAHDDEVRALLERAAEPVLGALRELRAEVLEQGLDSPLIRARLRAGDVRALAKVPSVKVVGEDAYPGEPQTTAWAPTVRTSLAHWISDGDVPACVLEGEQPNSYTNLQVAGIAAPAGATGGHMFGTLGVIRNTLGPTMTVSNQVFVGNWNGYMPTAAAPSTEQWCLNNGSVAINFSWSFSSGAPGAQSGSDAQKDFLTKRFPYPLFVKAAGNSGAIAGSDTVHNRSFNSLIVGASNDMGTSTIFDDTQAGFSSWRNPTSLHNDFELPNVVAPGVNLDAAGQTGLSGTSFAAPVTTGAVMLAARADMATFRLWPEMLRAVVTATAVHNIDGAALTRLPSADIRDGAGLVNSFYGAYLGLPGNFRAPGSAAASMGRHRKTLLFSSDFDAAGNGFDVYQIQAASTGRMRVAIAFDSTGTCGNSGCTDVLDADLDLHVRNSAGQMVCSSVTFDSSWEVCDFPVAAGQTFTARLKKWATNASSTYFGIAWFNWVEGNE